MVKGWGVCGRYQVQVPIGTKNLPIKKKKKKREMHHLCYYISCSFLVWRIGKQIGLNEETKGKGCLRLEKSTQKIFLKGTLQFHFYFCFISTASLVCMRRKGGG